MLLRQQREVYRESFDRWTDRKHFWTMRTADGSEQRGDLDNTPEAIQVWAADLEQRFPGRLIAVALEQARRLDRHAFQVCPPGVGSYSPQYPHQLSQSLCPFGRQKPSPQRRSGSGVDRV